MESRIAETRDRYDLLVRRGISGELRQRGAHLATRAKHHDVAFHLGKVGDQGLTWACEKRVKLLRRCEPGRQSGGIKEHGEHSKTM